MTWFKVDDGFWAHKKVLTASTEAVALWTLAGSWSAAQLTDGVIPRDMLPMLRSNRRAATELVRRGLWDTHPDGWQFHDWHIYQPTREAVEDRRDKRAKAGKLGGQASGKARRSKREASASTLVRPRANPRPDPTRPVPSSSGQVFEGGGSTATREQPPRKCPKHINNPDPPSCGSCAEARRAHDEWTPPIKPVVWSNCDEHGSHEGHICGACRSEMLTGERPWRAGYRQIGESA